MLSFAEEIMLLLLEDEDGRFVHAPDHYLRCVLSGAVLMDLALKGKIDTDLDSLVIIDPEPTGDDLLDPILERLTKEGEDHDAQYWVEHCQSLSGEIREKALARLCERGILSQEDDRFLWVFKSRRYPVVDGQAEREVKLRIMSILFSDEIPDPRDIAIVGLMDAGGLFKYLLSERELKGVAERIEQVRNMDLIGQAVTVSVREIERQLAQVTMAAARI